MLIRFLGNTWTLVAVWVLGPVLLFVLHRRNKAKEEEATRAPGSSASSSAPASSDNEGTRSGKTRPGLPAEEPMTGYEIREIPSGFRGIKWGDPPVDGMSVVHDEGNDKLMSRASDDLKIEGVPLTSVLYSFHAERLQ